jgi:hypothetical protein
VVDRSRRASRSAPVRRDTLFCREGVAAQTRVRTGVSGSVEPWWSTHFDPLSSTERVSVRSRMGSGIARWVEPLWSIYLPVAVPKRAACPRPVRLLWILPVERHWSAWEGGSSVVARAASGFSAGPRLIGVATISLLACWLMTRTRSAPSGVGRGIVERVRRRRRAGGSARRAGAGSASSGARRR